METGDVRPARRRRGALATAASGSGVEKLPSHRAGVLRDGAREGGRDARSDVLHERPRVHGAGGQPVALHEDLYLSAARAGRAGGARVRRHRHACGRVSQRREGRRGRQHAHPARVRRDGQDPGRRGEHGAGADPSGGSRGARQDPRRARLDDGRRREPRVLPQGAAHVRLGHHAAHAVQRHLARRAARGAPEVPHRLPRVDRAGDRREASLGGRPRAHAHHHAVLRVLQGQGAGHALAQRQGAFEGGAVPRADVQAAGRPDRRRLLVAARHGRSGALRREDRTDIRRREGARGGRAQDRHPPVRVRIRRHQAAGTPRQVSSAAWTGCRSTQSRAARRRISKRCCR